MLIIYSDLNTGGIQTFFLRLAKERFESGLRTYFLICNSNKNTNIYIQLKKYAEISHFSDFFYGVPFHKNYAILSAIPKKKKLIKFLDKVNSIHTSHGIYTLLAQKMMMLTSKNIPLTVGFYHSRTHSVGLYSDFYYDKINSNFILDSIPKENLFLFSSDIEKYYREFHNKELHGAHHFRLGVVNKEDNCLRRDIDNICISDKLNICSIGRIVDFKTYNFEMLKVISDLLLKGINVEYHIYGDGPEYNKISNEIISMGLSNNVFLKGVIPYEKFNQVVIKYDLFVGSGTAIIQASSLGVPSIVGIESHSFPYTYGFFSEVYEREYNIQELEIEKVRIIDKVYEFLALDKKEKQKLIVNHINCTNVFDNYECHINFENSILSAKEVKPYKYNKIRYDLSRIHKKFLTKFKSDKNG